MSSEIQCPQGHFYKPAFTGDQSCPHCASVNSNVFATKPIYEETESIEPEFTESESTNSTQGEGAQGRKTHSIYKFDDIQSVVGWLVCEKGPSKGQDYRIVSGRNFVGRDPNSSIYIREDEAISRKKHAVISFNPRKKSFSLANAESIGIIYHNDNEVSATVELKAFDRIEMGKSIFIFIPLCGAEFSWPDLA